MARLLKNEGFPLSSPMENFFFDPHSMQGMSILALSSNSTHHLFVANLHMEASTNR